MNRIELVAKRQDDLEGDRPDYSVYAGEQLVGRVYCQVKRSDVEEWFWSVNALTVDRTIGIAMHGYAADLDDAKDKLRAAFEAWLLWARAVPLSDLKRPHVEEETWARIRGIEGQPVPAPLLPPPLQASLWLGLG